MPSKAPQKKMGKTGDLPPRILAQVNRFLVEEVSYEEISDFLHAQGYEISKTTIVRYGREFLDYCRRHRVVEEKSRALTSDEESASLVEEAASRLFALMIVEQLLSGKINIEEMPKLLSDFARLLSSNVQREKLRREIRKRVEKTDKEVKRSAPRGLSDKTAADIRRKILGLEK